MLRILASAAVVAGGGFKMGQVIGETGRAKEKPYTPGNLFATFTGVWESIQP